MNHDQQIAGLDRLIAQKARKIEREARELRVLMKEREHVLASETTHEEETEHDEDTSTRYPDAEARLTSGTRA